MTIDYKSTRFWISAVLILVALIVILQNIDRVELQFLFWTVHISRVVLLPLLLAIGFAAGWMLRGQRDRRR